MKSGRRDLIKYLIVAIFILAVIVGWLGFGERGFIHLYRMDQERIEHINIIRDLEKKNQSLLDEIKRLRADKDYLESVARRELGLIKDNEIIYRFDEKEKSESSLNTNEK